MDTVKELESWARKNVALHYEDEKIIDSAIASMHELDWEGYYSEVDGRGYLTGNVVGIGTEGYINVGDVVYVREDALSKEQLRDVDEGQLGRIAPDGKKYGVEIHLSGIRAGIWSAEAVGDHNEFDTEAEAWAAIDQLKKIDEEWGSAEYRVVEMKL